MARAASDAEFDIIVDGVAQQKTPASALTKTATALSLFGYHKAPSLHVVTHPEYGKLFIYEFKATPFGNLVLTTGGSVWPTLEKEAEMPVASGVAARFAVAASPTDLPPRGVAAVERGNRAGARWLEREAHPPAIRRPRPAASVVAEVIPAAAVEETTYIEPRAPVIEEVDEAPYEEPVMVPVAEAPRRRGRPPKAKAEPVYVPPAPTPVYSPPPAAPAAGGVSNDAMLAALAGMIGSM